MGMDSLQLKSLVDECAPLVVGARVENVHQSSDESLCFSLYSRDAGKLILLFCLRPGLARFHLVCRRPVALLAPPPFCRALRKHLKGAHVQEIFAGERDSVRLVLRSPGEKARSRVLTLLFELKGERGRLSLVEARGKSLQLFEGGSSPKGSGGTSATAAVQATAITTALPPLHARMDALYTDKTVEVLTDDRRGALRKQLRRALSKRERLLVKIREDLERALRGKEAGQQGELLKGALGQVRRGMRSVEVQNYFDPVIPSVEISLDPARTPVENVELYFKRYKKSLRGIPIIEERLARLTDERDAMRELESCLEDAGTALDLDRLELRVRSLCGKAATSAQGGRAGARSASSRSGPRRFVSADGLDILVGRTASGNDELTFRMARGNDLFLHVSGRPGSHVIVRLDRGRPLPSQTLVDAAYLALYYSLRNRSRVRAVGAAADVDYSPVKHVRKPRGAAVGRVLLASHKTVRIRIEAARLERLLERRDRVGPN